MFNMILKYLRSGHLVQNLASEVLSELEVEAEYYQLTSLQEIIQQRLSVEDHNNSDTKDEVSVIYRGQTYKCKPHALQYCIKELIDKNGNFNARDISDHICLRQRNECGCGLPRETTPGGVVRRVLRRLEDNRVGDVEPPRGTELREDSLAALWMGLLPDNPNRKYFY